jgi:uncharacterized protein (TIGR02453 family)
MPRSPISPAVFRFLNELADNNDREWFNAHKQRYIEEVRDPLLQFVADFAPRLQKLSKNMVADPRPAGGSLFRIYRDTRFSQDKRPYKTHAGLTFRHQDGRDVHGPVFYLHLEPGSVFMAGGMWQPDADSLGRIRDAIVAHPGRWKRVLAKVELDEGHEGNRLKRAPRGFDPEHPFVEDLKRKSFTASTRFAQKEATAPDFPARFASACREKTPLMQFLTQAVGLPW